jgi:asparagine synthetase B (glutamine-hydrolysing)
LLEFNLDQYKTDFNDWDAAFAQSIAKRTQNTREQIFIGLSSGYDSGGIACELIAQDVSYKSYSLLGIEDPTVLEERIQIVAKHSLSELISPSAKQVQNASSYIKDHIEETIFYIYSEGTGHVETPSLHEDGGAVGLALVCARANNEGRKIYLSGQGADEIFSDYGYAGKRFYPHSNFGGQFPDELHEIFPWASFYGSSQESYLRKEEYVAGSFGIETRYPYLDKKVVQEFLNLSPGLKNCCYKSVLSNYLKKRQFPTLFDKKIGFYPK